MSRPAFLLWNLSELWAWLTPDLRLWRQAWRDLPDNPLAHYLALARRRDYLRLPRWRRHWLMLAVVGATAVYVMVVLGVQFALRQSIPAAPAGTMPSMPQVSPLVTVLSTLLLASTFVYEVWLLQGVYNAAQDSLRALGHTPRWVKAPSMDDLGLITPLGDRDIVLALLHVIFPPLAWRALVGAGVAVISIAAQAITLSSMFPILNGPQPAIHYADLFLGYHGGWADQLTFISAILPDWLQALLASPLTILGCAASGLLACVAGILLLLALGRESSENSAGVAAALLSAALLVSCWGAGWWRYSDMISAMGSSMGFGAPTPLDDMRVLGIYCASALLFALGIGGLLWLAQVWPGFRHALPIALPIVGVLIGAAALASQYLPFFYLSGNYVGFGQSPSGAASALRAAGYSVAWAWGSLLPYNLLAIPHPLCLGMDIRTERMLSIGEWLRWPLLVLLQLALILLCAGFARRAVLKRRVAG